jgi:hypothetical protein
VFERNRGDKGGGTDAEVAVDTRVRVYPDSDKEGRGVVVEDFGPMQSHAVDVGGEHFADPARRWAVRLDDGTLVFVDTEQLVAE